MIVYLYQVRYMLNRVHRTCRAFGVTDIRCIQCSAGAIRDLQKRGLNVTVEDRLPAGPGLVALESTYPMSLNQVDWTFVDRVLLGSEKAGLPVQDIHAGQAAHIPMMVAANVHGLTVEAALAVALYDWKMRSGQ